MPKTDTMTARISMLCSKLGFIELQMKEAVREAGELAAFRDALNMAHVERTGLPLNDDDEIDQRDEARAEEILKLYPQ
jgi:hypothetical protein